MGPFIKMIWFVAVGIFAVLILEIILFVGSRQEYQSNKKNKHSAEIVCP